MSVKGFSLTLVIIAAFVVYGKPSKPIAYTSGYASVSYQPKTKDNTDTDNTKKASGNNENNNNTDIDDGNSKKVSSNQDDENKNDDKSRLNSKMGKEREEVTEKSISKVSNDHTEITTERDSEQINLARLKNRNIYKNDKLQGDNEKKNNTDIDFLSDKNTRILEPAELADLNMDSEVDFVKKNIKSDKLQTRDGSEFMKMKNYNIDSDESTNEDLALEASDLNSGVVYYIYHPSGLLQKVVYASENFPEENMSPIVEPILTYDPSTFVLQRLQVLSNS